MDTDEDCPLPGSKTDTSPFWILFYRQFAGEIKHPGPANVFLRRAYGGCCDHHVPNRRLKDLSTTGVNKQDVEKRATNKLTCLDMGYQNSDLKGESDE